MEIGTVQEDWSGSLTFLGTCARDGRGRTTPCCLTTRRKGGINNSMMTRNPRPYNRIGR